MKTREKKGNAASGGQHPCDPPIRSADESTDYLVLLCYVTRHVFTTDIRSAFIEFLQ